MLIPNGTSRRALQTLGGGYRVSTDLGEAYCIFQNAYASALLGGMELADSGPRLTMASCDVAPLGLHLRGATLRIIDDCGDATVYRMRNHEPDGTGLSVLKLDATQ